MARKTSRRGFTLIEVVIALIIFVIGALAVIRIFPPTFNAVQGSSYQNIAARMADSIINQMKSEASTPHAVFDVDGTDSDDNGIPDWLESSTRSTVELAWEDQDGAVEGTVTKNGSLPAGPTELDYQESALSHFRFVRGEVGFVQNTSGSGKTENGVPDSNNHPYLLTNFPYTAAPNGGVRLFVTQEIKGVTIDVDGRLNFSHSNLNDPAHKNRPPEIISSSTNPSDPADRYAIRIYRSIVNTGGGNIVDTGARFYVSYRYVDGDTGKIAGVVNEPVSLPSNASWDAEVGSGNDDVNYVLQGMLRRKLAANKPSILAGSVQVTARAALVFIPQGITDPPSIETAVTESIPLGTDQDAGDAGYVSIPVAYTQKEFTDSGGNPIVGYYSAFPADRRISVDYLVPDWRILLNEQSMTSSGGEVLLPINLFPGFTPHGVALDRTSNYKPVGGVLTPAPGGFEKRTVDFGSHYPVMRTAFKALDQWATQISPAAESYLPFIDNATISNFRDPTVDAEHYYLPREPWREYYWAAGSNTIYFHPSEAGKTVKVQFIPNGATQPIDQVLTISKDIIDIPTGFPANFAGSGYTSELIVTDNSGNPINADSILRVTGMSVLARTAWLNGKSYAQAISTGYR